ncbi:MAG: hypothetical protein JWM40_158 [Frankiales bacterium]|nr:hypothetical protein [Frankiales bacterium]
MRTRAVPTRALLLPLLGAVVLNLLSGSSADPWLALASAALVALPLASLGLRPSLRHVEVRHDGPARVVAGEAFDLDVVVRNTGDRDSPPMLWRHEHPALSTVEVAVPGLLPGEQVAVPARREAFARGVHVSSQGVLTTTSPFGLIRWSRPHLPTDRPLIVHPVIGSAGELLDGGAAAATDRTIPVPGAGLEVLDLRPWRPGDARREVSARASARHGRPVVLQRERDAGPSLVVLVEGGGRGPVWERAVSAAATTCVAAVRAGQPPVLLADPPPGRVDAVGLLDFFAGVDGCAPLRPRDIAAAVQHAGRGGTVLVLTPRGINPRLWSAAVAAGCRLEVAGGE